MKLKNRIWFCFFIGFFLLSGCQKQEEVFTIDETSEQMVDSNKIESTELKNDKKIFVYVCGFVKKPGVYTVKEDARIYDALLLAGGITKDGNGEGLNQAEKMVDGQTIYVPGIEESHKDKEDDGKININDASKEEMMNLPGIGESKADLIVRYREEHGSFKTIEMLMDIPGIKKGVFEKIKDKIKVR